MKCLFFWNISSRSTPFFICRLIYHIKYQSSFFRLSRLSKSCPKKKFLPSYLLTFLQFGAILISLYIKKTWISPPNCKKIFKQIFKPYPLRASLRFAGTFSDFLNQNENCRKKKFPPSFFLNSS